MPGAHPEDWRRRHWTSRTLYRFAEIVAHSSAGVVAAIVVVGWALLGEIEGFPHWWETGLYATTGTVTFVMVFVIQHTQQRQTAAIQRKIDELLRATDGADDSLIAVEEAPDEELAELASLNLDDRQRASTSPWPTRPSKQGV